ncbi:hypothetical protein CALCODRAFT_484812 [Calocera cornea HHB12733]|uniref:Uncharacterized protein n=1 Tax=Calocera cornea HHB12733 TaxID=1353952 RepID=A0A165ESF8_9BASI|nr:hypothetical protein CALCODRAFT_484812 [Calocera cornea HHB12733]
MPRKVTREDSGVTKDPYLDFHQRLRTRSDSASLPPLTPSDMSTSPPRAPSPKSNKRSHNDDENPPQPALKRVKAEIHDNTISLLDDDDVEDAPPIAHVKQEQGIPAAASGSALARLRRIHEDVRVDAVIRTFMLMELEQRLEESEREVDQLKAKADAKEAENKRLREQLRQIAQRAAPSGS